MDDGLPQYDEFGNYIGPALDSDEDEDDDEEEKEEEEESEGEAEEGGRLSSLTIGNGGSRDSRMDVESSIVLHEDKQYYPDASDVYGEAEAVVLDEDAQGLDEPLIAPVKAKSYSILEKEVPELKCPPEYMAVLMETPSLIRNLAVAGHLHSGKTSLMDVLVGEARADGMASGHYTDTRKDEQSRGMSIKSCPVSLALCGSTGKHYLMNLVDCPGHVNFEDETVAAMRACDGLLLVVDAVEGVMMQTERVVASALAEGLSIVLLINKVDRLILELKLPPRDAYYKLQHTLEDVNALIAKLSPAGEGSLPRLDPSKGNVCFASSLHGWVFSLQSFADVYCSGQGRGMPSVDSRALAARLWGNSWFDPSSRRFVKKQPPGGDLDRSFVSFILNPLYKVYSAVMGEDAASLRMTMEKLGVVLSATECGLDPKPLLRLVCGRAFSHVSALVDCAVAHVPSPEEVSTAKVRRIYTGDASSERARAMCACDPLGPLMINVVKLYSAPDGQSFTAFGRIYSGSVRAGQLVRVLGETYSEDDDEDMAVREVTAVSAPGGRHRLELSLGKAGNWVLLEGVDSSIMKTATITDETSFDEARIFRLLSFAGQATMKLAVEPLNPAELPKMVEGLRSVSKSYPLAGTKVEESGEHVVYAIGELQMDCIMHDLREMYSEVEVKVADPSCRFCETVVDTSSIKCWSETPNKRNKLTMIAEPLDEGLAEDIEGGAVDVLGWDKKELGNFFRTKYDWDLLAARSVWAFGPDERGPNVLLDDTLPSEVDKTALGSIRSSVVQGFQWGCREGPLCDEPIRNTKFKILDAVVAAEAIHRGGGQIIPTARRVSYSALLMATPRLMEPIYAIEVQCPADVVGSIYPVLQKRRGHVVQDAPKPGAPFYTLKAYIPVIDSFGFETDLRSYTQGQAFCMQVFDHWSIVPGDPLDRNIVLHPLEPSPPQHLAREFMVKTRRRKGLSEDVTVSKFFDDPSLLEGVLLNGSHLTSGL